ncbi:MAG: TonB family protein [Candidatus Avelusimicrobium sp.]|uniref:TonB family protein n=1 Tax=Candidatus Avelusimicrobium sp. TaxID=3048833 RepID=UPI003EFFBC0F
MINKYTFVSGGLHVLAALFLLLALSPSAKKASSTYTIDFIGTGKVIATTGQEAVTPKVPKAAVQTAAPAKEAEVKKEAPKPSKKAYAAKEEISTKKQPAKKAAPKELPAAEPLGAPSVLDDEPAKGENSSSKEGEFEGGNIQTDFANFPYPWYITQVRNSLWIEWEKRRPAGSTLSALVTFAIARDGKVKDLKVERKSGDDTFDFAASSAVINAGPFAPLPMYYEKDELTVSVEFKQEK